MRVDRIRRLIRVGADRVLSPSGIVRVQRMRRRIFRTDQRLSDTYLAANSGPKLHIGGGEHRLDGWLNTDIELIPDVMVMDATKPFPFADNTIQFVYTEHMIEHVSREGALRMLRECHRVMRDGGVIRVTTPNLATLLGLYSSALSDTQRGYVSWFCQTFLAPDVTPSAVSVINAHFRMWGHEFVYDEPTLTNALHDAGFKSVRRRCLTESDHAALRDLENVERYPAGLLDFESIALEAVK